MTHHLQDGLKLPMAAIAATAFAASVAVTGIEAQTPEKPKAQVIVEMRVVELSQEQCAKLMKSTKRVTAASVSDACERRSFPFANIMGGGQVATEENPPDTYIGRLVDLQAADFKLQPETQDSDNGSDTPLFCRSLIEMKGALTEGQLRGVEKEFASVGCAITKIGPITLDDGVSTKIGGKQNLAEAHDATGKTARTADVKATIEPSDEADGAIDLEIMPQWTHVVALMTEKEGQLMFAPAPPDSAKKSSGTPVIDEASGDKAESAISIWSGQTVVLAGRSLELVQAKGEKAKLDQKTVVLLISVRIVDARTIGD